jgi:hypothetical protein
MKIDEDLEWFLLAGDPIFLENAGNVYPLKLKEIKDMRFSIYNSIIYVLFNKQNLSKENIFDDIVKNCIDNKQYEDLVLFALESFFKLKVEFSLGVFLIKHDCGIGVLDSSNYMKFLDIVKMNCCLKFDADTYAPANERAREMIERIKKNKQKKEGIVKNDRSLIKMIAGVANKSKHYNHFNVWDLTLYQFYDVCNKENILDNIHYTLLGYYSGNIRKEDVDFKSLDWTNKPNPLTE